MRRRRPRSLNRRPVAGKRSQLALGAEQCRDAVFLEQVFIPSLGLNDEILQEQPPELAENAASVESCMEIGCRWGGMLILVTEWLRHNGANIRHVIAVDPIAPTPFIDEYFKIVTRDNDAGTANADTLNLRKYSTAPVVSVTMDRIRPDVVFIDGYHGLRGALSDHMLARKYAKMTVHHSGFDMTEFVDQYDSVRGNLLGVGAMKRRDPATPAQAE